MSVRTKQIIIAVLSLAFLASLLLVQWEEVARKEREAGLTEVRITVPENSRDCVDCHTQANPGIVAHWKGSTHAQKGVGCIECHVADKADVDSFQHYNATIATIVAL